VDIALLKSTTALEASADKRTHAEFVALVDAHGGAVLATLRRLCGNAHEADDLFQETAVRVWRHFDKRPWLRSPRAWLITIAYRTFLDSRRRRQIVASDGALEVIDHRQPSVEKQAEDAELHVRVEKQIQSLPHELQQVLALHYQGGLSIRQTAAAMETTVATTKNRLHAALKRLRDTLR
jgi:RNA polymerase sigma-70 factor (ECF subfamily)